MNCSVAQASAHYLRALHSPALLLELTLLEDVG